eukprot:2841167-Amphidinium_carterae.2
MYNWPCLCTNLEASRNVSSKANVVCSHSLLPLESARVTRYRLKLHSLGSCCSAVHHGGGWPRPDPVSHSAMYVLMFSYSVHLAACLPPFSVVSSDGLVACAV